MFETIGSLFIFLIARDCHIVGYVELSESFHILFEVGTLLIRGQPSIWKRECSRWRKRFAEANAVKVPSVSLHLLREGSKSNISIRTGNREQIGRLGRGSRRVIEEKRRSSMSERYRWTKENKLPKGRGWKIGNNVACMHDAKVATKGSSIGTCLVVLVIKSGSKS